MTDLARTPLHPWHVAHGGRMVDFAHWSMPVQYGSIVEEHQATRKAIGLFDVSHMGRLLFTGPDCTALLDRLLTRRVTDLAAGRIRYSLMCNERGGILDDVLIYRLTGGSDYQLVVNASNRQKIVDWIESHRDGAKVKLVDSTTQTAMIAVQGPGALTALKPLSDLDLPAMKYYSAQRGQIAGRPALVSRTGYTGEDGCELILDASDAVAVWEAILTAGEPLGARAAGLAARDTLRLEAAMPLYGHELTESIDPFQAGLQFAVNLDDREFLGSQALRQSVEKTDHPRRVGLTLEGRRVPRETFPIVLDTRSIGFVTSGTFSPTFDQPIAMGYVQPEHAELGRSVSIDIRGRHEPATIVSLPFYKRQS